MSRSTATTRAAATGVPRRARAVAAVLFTLLLVPGFVGFDAWPLTAWRLFSADRGDTQTRYEVAVVGSDGTLVPVDLDELPIAFRNGEWILAELPRDDRGDGRREEVCQAVLAAVRDHVDPDAAGLALVRNRRTMVEDPDGGFRATDDREPIHVCEAP